MKLSSAYLLSLSAILVQADPSKFPGSVSSWGEGRLDVYINAGGKLLHKYHANPEAGWNNGFEELDIQSLESGVRPASVSWSADRTDVFVVADDKLVHKFWDGSQWQPASSGEILAEGLDGDVAVTAWDVGRFDIIGRALDGGYYHKYYDGDSWQPAGYAVEDLGKDGFEDQVFESSPAAVSWGKNQLDIFGILSNGTLLHKWWDGYQWNPSNSGWQQWGDGLTGDPVATSWASNRLDVWAVKADTGETGPIAHRYWNGYELSDLETLGGSFYDTPSVTHWDKNRIDIFGNDNASVYYKYWDGHQWNPSDVSASWYEHGPAETDADYEPISASWASNNLHAFTIDEEGTLKWQLWEGSQWLPKSNDFYNLGKLPDSIMTSGDRTFKQGGRLVVQDAEKNFDL